MKRSICLVLIILGFAACKKDNGGPASSSIMGRWTFVADTLTTSVGDKLLIKSNYFSAGGYLQFNADGTGQNQYSIIYNSAFTFTQAQNRLVISYPARTIIVDRAIYQYNAHTDTLTIKTLSKNHLTLVYDKTTVADSVAQRDYQVEYLTR